MTAALLSILDAPAESFAPLTPENAWERATAAFKRPRDIGREGLTPPIGPENLLECESPRVRLALWIVRVEDVSVVQVAFARPLCEQAESDAPAFTGGAFSATDFMADVFNVHADPEEIIVGARAVVLRYEPAAFFEFPTPATEDKK